MDAYLIQSFFESSGKFLRRSVLVDRWQQVHSVQVRCPVDDSAELTRKLLNPDSSSMNALPEKDSNKMIFKEALTFFFREGFGDQTPVFPYHFQGVVLARNFHL